MPELPGQKPKSLLFGSTILLTVEFLPELEFLIPLTTVNNSSAVNNTAASEMSDISMDTGSVPTEEKQTLDLVHQLLGSFTYGRSGMVFACGGKMPIPAANNTAQQSSTIVGAAPTCQPVTLRWDPQSQYVPACACKLQFPLDCSDSATANNIQRLLVDMQPATFGYQGQDVVDESYHKASKLDPSRFDCTFNPYDMGIIDEVAQILLPGVKRKTTSNNNSAGNPRTEGINVLRAELHKLNVYSSPSGHLKAHVDAPRSNEQIGSLVVCLPSAHQGGQLEVRHQGQSIKFDWSMPWTARPELQWAAFYSGCEHEVMNVTSGHLITLTYNLFARNTSNTGTPQAGRGLMDPTQLPLYGNLHSLFLQESFMPDGGHLGVHTSHAYPHTSTSARLPATLKGIDMVVWETFRSLGCGMKLRPVVEMAGEYHYGHEVDWHGDCPAVELSDASSKRHWGSDEDDDSDIGANETRATHNDDDQAMTIESGASTSGSEHQDIDADELQALQEEREQPLSAPSSGASRFDTPGDPIPRDDFEDEEWDPDDHKGRRNDSWCRVLGNNLGFHTEHGFLVKSDECMRRLLDKWMKTGSCEPEGPTTQPERLLYEEVSWLNRSAQHREPQIAYADVSCP